MSSRTLPRLLIGAVASGSGKTTITCGLLQALINRGLQTASFKCGPDYIDPMFHQEVIGAHSRNLDLFFMNEATVKGLLGKNANDMDISIIEGVMGFYDGLGGCTTTASTYDLARVTQTPVVLVINCKGMSVSVAAQIKGFLEFRADSQICGVILNQVSAMLYPTLKSLVEEELGLQVFGYLPYLPDILLESRHLGLITPQEVVSLKEKLGILADRIEDTINISGLLEVARNALPIEGELPPVSKPIVNHQPVIAVAKDKAFGFYYADSLDLLRELGAELIYFSPLYDQKLPPNVNGIYLGGGYPELHAKELANNQSMKESLKSAIDQGIPTFAECGGFMYLQEFLEGKDGVTYPMVGAIDGKSYATAKLSRFGYITLTAQEDNLLCRQGQSIRAHEFHYWDSTNCGSSFLAEKWQKNKGWNAMIAKGNLLAGYPHIHFYANPEFAVNFVTKCGNYQG